MRVFNNALVAILACSVALLGQSNNWKKSLEQELQAAYPVTKFAILDAQSVSKAGPIFTIEHDAVLAERTEASGIRGTFIKNGKLRQDNGSGALVDAIFSGKGREDARTFKKGERVYVTTVSVQNTQFEIALTSVELSEVRVNGRTNQTRFKGVLVFEFDKGALQTMDAASLKPLIQPFLRSESEAAAPKSIELNQTIAEVESMFGKPTTIVKLGAKTIYTYKDIKVTFTDGKVTDVQ